MKIYIAGQLLTSLQHFENEDKIKINVTLIPLWGNYNITILQLNFLFIIIFRKLYWVLNIK